MSGPVTAAPAEQLLELPVAEFVARTAAPEPTPGGGSVAAVTGALASALVAMVARLTDRKKGYEQAWELAAAAARRAIAGKSPLSNLADGPA